MCSSDDEVQIPTAIIPLPPARWAGALPQQPALPFMSEVAVQLGSLPSLAKALEAVPEHRKPRGFKAHQPPVPLIPTLLLLIAAVMCGRRGFGSIAGWGRQCTGEQPGLVTALGFALHRRPCTPAAATFFRLLRDMHLRQFQVALQGWLEEVASLLHVSLPEWEKVVMPEDQVALDGKTIRGASARREKTEGQSAPVVIQVVGAYAPALQTVLDQVVSEGKGHELAAVKLLLGQMDLKGRVITADALACQREVCETITAKEGDYLLPVDGNQPALLDDIQEAFSPSASAGPTDADYAAARRPGRGEEGERGE